MTPLAIADDLVLAVNDYPELYYANNGSATAADAVPAVAQVA